MICKLQSHVMCAQLDGMQNVDEKDTFKKAQKLWSEARGGLGVRCVCVAMSLTKCSCVVVTALYAL